MLVITTFSPKGSNFTCKETHDVEYKNVEYKTNLYTQDSYILFGKLN
jgi:hypothetical protein